MKNKGITLIVLVVTIVILLILAGVIIGTLTGENGLIGNSREAKEKTGIENEKEVLEQATIEAMGKDKYGNIIKINLEQGINKIIGEGKTEVNDLEESMEVYFIESKRYYKIDKNGNVSEYKTVAQDKYPGDITKDENGNILDGTQEHPYEINCIENLVAFSNISSGNSFANKYIILTRDVDFHSKYSYMDYQRTDFGDINGEENDGNQLMNEMKTSKGFKPISWFAGIFDGKNHKIENIYEKRSGAESGLFASISTGAIIKNISLSGKNESESNYIGGFIGTIKNGEKNGKIENCHNFCNIYGNSYAGGIVANTDSANMIIEQCYNSGKINNGSGIAGNSKSVIRNCYNRGQTSYGLVNSNQGKLYNSYSIGKSTSGALTRNNYYTNSYISKCYYDETSANKIAENYNSTTIDLMSKGMKREEMKQSEFVDILNQYEDGTIVNAWKKDEDKINEGYPVLNWQ